MTASLLDRLISWFSTSEKPVKNGEIFRRCMQNPDEARQLLAREQRELAEALAETNATYEARLTELAKKVSQMDDATLRRELALIQEAQIGLRRVIRRADVANHETRELLDEWRDWERMEDAHPTERDERQELLRSELAVRGVAVGNNVRVAPEPIAPQMIAVPVEAADRSCETDESNRSYEPSDLPEWEEFLAPHIAPSAAYWDAHLASINEDLGDPQQLARLYSLLRAAHADKQRFEVYAH